MSYYTDYIQELCPYSEEWVVEQICGELDRRDDEIKELKEENKRLKEKLDGFIYKF